MMGLQETFEMLLLIMTVLYGCTIMVFTIGLTAMPEISGREANTVRGSVSVIIPVRNEAGNILRILEEIRGQDFPPASMEVIVTDDQSEDATMSLAGWFAGEYPGFPLILVNATPSGRTEPGKKGAIERAAAIAGGEILLLTDADTGRGAGWVASMVSCFANPGIRMAMGPVHYCREKNLLQKIQSLEFMGLMGTTAGSAFLGYPLMCNGANLACRRDAFIQTGGFSSNSRYRSGDDQFLMSAVRKQFGNGALMFHADPAAAVSTEPEATLKGFLNQRIRWVSKSRGYRDAGVIMVGMITWMVHALMLAGMIAGLFDQELLTAVGLLWMLKMVLEFPMVWIMAGFFENRRLTGYYLPAQVFQLFYVPLAGILGLMLPYRWKGRRGLH